MIEIPDPLCDGGKGFLCNEVLVAIEGAKPVKLSCGEIKRLGLCP